MRISPLALATALAAGWAALPSVVRANEGGRDGDEETIEVHKDGDRETIVRKRVRRDDRDEGGGGQREGMVGREPGEGPRGPGGPQGLDPEMKEKHEKIRDLEQKVRELSKTLRQGSDSDKAAAKNEARKVLGDLFDAKLEMDSSMLAKMEKHVAELKAKVARKKSSRDKAIESRLARMSGEGDDW